jgi:pyruvate dehydrogenase E1 component beta subunit
MSGGQFNVPLVIRMATGAGRQLAAQHSHSLGGLVRAHPRHQGARAGDARGRARHALPALEDPDPVLIFEHGMLYNMEGELRADAGPGRHRRARRRAGPAAT